MPDRQLNIVVNADTTQAEQQVQNLENKPVNVPVDIDLSNIEKQLSTLRDKMLEISRAFNKNVDFSKIQKSVTETEKHIKSMMSEINGKKALNVNQLGFDGLKADISDIKTDLKSIGNISPDLTPLQKMESLLQGIQDILESIKIGFKFDEILPTSVIEREIDKIKEERNEFLKLQNDMAKSSGLVGKNSDIESTFTTTQNRLLNQTYGSAARQIMEGSIDWTDAESRIKNLIRLMNQYTSLGGSLKNLSLSYPTITFDYSQVYDELNKLYSVQNGEKVKFDIPFSDNAEVTGAIKGIQQYNAELQRLDAQLADAQARERQNVTASFDDESMMRFTSSIREAIQSISSLKEETGKGMSSAVFDDMAASLQNISEIIQRISGIDLSKLDSELKESFNQKPVEIEVKPVVSNPGAFVSEIQSQLKGHPIEVEIQAKKTIDENKNTNTENTADNAPLKEEQALLSSLQDRVDAVRLAVGQKTDAFQTEGQTVIATVQREISSLNDLLEIVNKITQELRLLTKADNVDRTDAIGDSETKSLNNLRDALNSLDPSKITELSTTFTSLSDKEIAGNIQAIASALTELKTSLNGIGVNNSFLADIKEIISQGEALNNLANILRKSAQKINTAKKAVTDGTSESATRATSQKNNQADIYQRARAELEPALKDIEDSLGLGKLTKTEFSTSGNAAVTFVQRIGTEAETTVIRIKDLEAALNALSAGNFDKIYKDISTINKSTSSRVPKDLSNSQEVTAVAQRQQNISNVLKSQFRISTGKQNTGRANESLLINDTDLKNLDEYTKKTKQATEATKKYAQIMAESNINHGNYKDGFIDKHKIDWKKLSDEIRQVRDTYVDQAKSMTGIFDNVEAFGGKSPNFSNSLNDLKSKLSELSTFKIDLNADASMSELQRLISTVEKLQAELRSSDMDLADSLQISKLQKQIAAFGEKNSKAVNDSAIGPMYRNLVNSVSSAADQGNMSKGELKGFTAELNRIVAATSQAEKSGKSFFDSWKSRMGDLAVYLASFASFYDIINMLQQGVQTIRDLDTAFVEMQKVSDESLSTLKEYQNLSFNLGDEVGTTGEQIMQSTADWMRLGESLQEAQESAQTSNVLLNVSEFENIGTATDSLVSVSQAYKDLEKTDIVDKLNNIGNNFSISTDGLASALQRSASALVTAGNDIDEANALIVAGNQVAQDPESVGAGMRTIALRIQGTEEAKAELEELGEDTEDFVVQTSSKIDESVRNFTAVASNNFEGVSILDENGNYRSTYEILQDIADIYDEIVETDQKYGTNHMAGLLELLAGKNRANIAASILQNGDVLRSAYEASQNSEGSAQQELDKYLNSVEGKITQLTNNLQELAFNVIDTDIFKGSIDGANTLLNIINQIVSALGMIPVLAGGAGIGAFIKNLDRPEITGFVY